MVHLSGRGLSTPGVQPTADERAQLRSLLTTALAVPVDEKPRTPLAGYTGFLLVDPFDDDRLTALSEVADFTPLRRWSDVHHVYDGVLERRSTRTLHPATELEEWLKALWVRRGLPLPPDEW